VILGANGPRVPPAPDLFERKISQPLMSGKPSFALIGKSRGDFGRTANIAFFE